MAYLYETNSPSHWYPARRRCGSCEAGAPDARTGSRLGQDPTTTTVLQSQATRLAGEIKTLAEARAWTRVEALYLQLESMGNEAFASIPNASEVHHIGAVAADIFGNTQLRQTRLVREKYSLETTGESLTGLAYRTVIAQLDAIEKAYGSVTVAPRSRPISKRSRLLLELIPAALPSVPEQRRSIEAAAAALKESGEFNGLLPVGNYVLKSGKRPLSQPFTVSAGTELVGKKRLAVVWDN